MVNTLPHGYNVLTIMARGLSDLQKAILVLAYHRHQERLEQIATAKEGSHEHLVLTRGVGSIDLFNAEVLHEHFGLPVCSHWWRPERGERPRWGNNFCMRVIGEKRYRCAQASTSRAVKRLQERGLVERVHGWCAGMRLTDDGVTTAEDLSVNTSPERADF